VVNFKELSGHNRDECDQIKLHKNINARNTLITADLTPTEFTKEMGIQFRLQLPVLEKK
jgi:hypothetical protein